MELEETATGRGATSGDPAAAVAGAGEERPAGVVAEITEAEGKAAVDEFSAAEATGAAVFAWKAGCAFFTPKEGIMARMI